MTTRFALVFVLLVAAGFLADSAFNGGQGSLFLARKLVDLIDYVMFWR